jgi:hypothetical protein
LLIVSPTFAITPFDFGYWISRVGLVLDVASSFHIDLRGFGKGGPEEAVGRERNGYGEAKLKKK